MNRRGQSQEEEKRKSKSQKERIGMFGQTPGKSGVRICATRTRLARVSSLFGARMGDPQSPAGSNPTLKSSLPFPHYLSFGCEHPHSTACAFDVHCLSRVPKALTPSPLLSSPAADHDARAQAAHSALHLAPYAATEASSAGKLTRTGPCLVQMCDTPTHPCFPGRALGSTATKSACATRCSCSACNLIHRRCHGAVWSDSSNRLPHLCRRRLAQCVLPEPQSRCPGG